MSGKNKKTFDKPKVASKSTSKSRAVELLGGNLAGVNAFKANAALAFSQFGRESLQDYHDTDQSSEFSNCNSDSIKNSHQSFSRSKSSKKDSKHSTKKFELPPNSPIDDNLANLVKRMAKKDVTTRLKTLNEIDTCLLNHLGTDQNSDKFSNQAHNKDALINCMLMGWPSVFESQIFDIDMRVRISTLRVHNNFIDLVGKKSALVLNQIMGPWLASFFDLNNEVSKISKSIFNSNFGKNTDQKSRVLDFCQSGILEFLISNLIDSNEDSFGDKRYSDPEELKFRYQMIIAESMKTLEYMLESSTPELVSKHLISYKNLLQNESMWSEFLNQKHESSHILTSALSCFSVFMKKVPKLDLDSEVCLKIAKNAVKFALSSKRDFTTQFHIWDPVIYSTMAFPEIWFPEKDSPKNKMIGYLTRYFKSGDANLAPSVSYPSLFLLLNFIPKDVISENLSGLQILDSIWAGAPIDVLSFTSLSNQNNYTMTQKKINEIPKRDQNPKTLLNSRKSVTFFLNSICECSMFIWTLLYKKISAVDDSHNEAFDSLSLHIKSSTESILDLSIKFGSTNKIADSDVEMAIITGLFGKTFQGICIEDDQISFILNLNILPSFQDVIQRHVIFPDLAYSSLHLLSSICNLTEILLESSNLTQFSDKVSEKLKEIEFWALTLSKNNFDALITQINPDSSNSVSSNGFTNTKLILTFIDLFPNMVFPQKVDQLQKNFESQASTENSSVFESESLNLEPISFFYLRWIDFLKIEQSDIYHFSLLLEKVFVKILGFENNVERAQHYTTECL
ncbi:E3 ubiquitin-protein ligase listerin [Smittium mucronatum]|uniref:E3 ubiquitin-protein ligase listerin n=1 Tax=Smittium mucronatum TaxID=133383 RepID=A0A1R0H760_9FUNG|nr:E3 ubiquitin-protein ligase listerin [Smittium mucronatum]